LGIEQRDVMMQNEIIILGSGTSTGIPMLNCQCSVCTSSDKRNQRLRTGLYLKTAKGNHLVIDTTPDIRYQLLREKISIVDAAIITHDHADHLHGIDDLRPFTFGPPARVLPVFTPSEFVDSITQRFPYIFKRHQIFDQNRPYRGGGLPLLDLHAIAPGPVKILNEDFYFYRLPHGHAHSFSFVHERFAYIIDCHEVPAPVTAELRQRQLDLLIIDCLQEDLHASHLSRSICFAAIEAINPKRAILIHMNHHFDHEQLSKLAKDHLKVPTEVAIDRQRLYY
jgi:phosphoribosyl 1,2-cyclic phosphate phosphodiesterase